jgi:uncharacterized coiled-coil protein SlyX
MGIKSNSIISSPPPVFNNYSVTRYHLFCTVRPVTTDKADGSAAWITSKEGQPCLAYATTRRVLLNATISRIPPIAVAHLAARQFTMDVLLNELAFQKVLLSSIDDTVQNREAAEEEIRAEIRALEKQIRNLKRSTTAASQPQPSRSSQSLRKSSSSPSKKPNAGTGTGAVATPAMDGYLSRCSPLDCSQTHIRISLSPPIFSHRMILCRQC